MVTKLYRLTLEYHQLFYSSERIDGNETEGKCFVCSTPFYSSERIDGNETPIIPTFAIISFYSSERIDGNETW